MKILFLTLILSLFAGATAITAQIKHSTKKTAMNQESEKIVYEPDAELLHGLQGKVRIVESKQDWETFNRQSPISNKAHTRSAYTAQFKIKGQPDVLLEVIVVHDAASDKMFEIRGFDDFPWRPFSDFKWITNDVLQFEQWVNPHNGGRYQVNLKTGKIVAAGYVRSN